MYVDRLIAEGFLDESGVNQGPMGRPRRTLKTMPKAGWFAGVEFHAQRVQTVGIDFSGKAGAAVTRLLPEDVTAEIVIKVILACVERLAESMNGPLLMVGLGAPGLVDPKEGVGLLYAFIPDWVKVPVCRLIGEKLGVPVILQNNLRAIAIAERWFGVGHDVTNYVILGPRSGFGIAMVQDGKLVEGARHAAGEVGRWPLAGNAEKGRELHHTMSAPAVWRRLAGVSETAKLPDDLRSGVAEFANVRSTEWNSICLEFARVIVCLQFLTDTEVFILHGPLTGLGEHFCESIILHMRSLAPSLAECPLRLIPSSLGDDAGALGAASLAMEAWNPC